MHILDDWVGLHKVFWNKNRTNIVDCSFKIVRLTGRMMWESGEWSGHGRGGGTRHGHFHPLFSNRHIFSLGSGHCQTDRTKDIRITHCKENPIYVFLSWELRGLGSRFHIHVTVSDLYVFLGSVRIFPCSRIGRPIPEIYKSLTDKWV
jgi:hypothetical protein